MTVRWTDFQTLEGHLSSLTRRAAFVAAKTIAETLGEEIQQATAGLVLGQFGLLAVAARGLRAITTGVLGLLQTDGLALVVESGRLAGQGSGGEESSDGEELHFG